MSGSIDSSRTRKPSASTTPRSAASRSPSEMAAAIQTASVPVTSGARPDTSPPAPALGHQVAVVAQRERQRTTVGHDHDRALCHGARSTPTRRRGARRARTDAASLWRCASSSLPTSSRAPRRRAPSPGRSPTGSGSSATTPSSCPWPTAARASSTCSAGPTAPTTVTGPARADRSRPGGGCRSGWRSSRWRWPRASTSSAAPTGNDPVDATTAGTGELIALAVESGARRVLVGRRRLGHHRRRPRRARGPPPAPAPAGDRAGRGVRRAHPLRRRRRRVRPAEGRVARPR